jgi:NAD(P)-dependent dehydrogenase (short-subunit alcohol dehydrogenase family)
MKRDWAGNATRERLRAADGGGSGIGRALALTIAREGADLALADIDATALEATAAAVRASGVCATAHVVDVGDAAAVAQLAEDAVAGLGRVNLLINNAGVALIGPPRTSSIGSCESISARW